MSGHLLTPKDRVDFLKALKSTKKPALIHRRINALLLLDQGWQITQVAEALYLDERTVNEYQRLYQEGGASAVVHLGYQGNTFDMLSEEQKEALKQHLSERCYLTSQAVCDYVKRTFSVAYTTNAMTKVLKRIGFSYKKPKRFPAKANRSEQSRFLKERLAPAVAEASEATPLYFMDATHVQHNSAPAYGWFLKGEETLLKSNAGRQRISINGAYCLHDDAVVYRQDKTVNGLSNTALLQAVVERHPEAKTIRIVMDGAPCNHGPDVRAFLADHPQLEIIKLPPYSPNLNLIERLWLLFKKTVIYNRFHPTWRDFISAITAFFESLPQQKDVLASLLTPKFHLFDATPGA